MSTWWEGASANCQFCNAKIAELKVVRGKVNISERTEHWGTFVKVPGKSVLKAICRNCQKKQSAT